MVFELSTAAAEGHFGALATFGSSHRKQLEECTGAH
jgi:hypothetical protein